MNHESLVLSFIGRSNPLFDEDIKLNQSKLLKTIENSNFLVIGGAGSIGQAVSKEIFKRNPKKLHVVDINENNMVELVRDIRSTLGYIEGDFKTYAIDCGSEEFAALIKSEGPYDYVFNLSALKHVRSEKDPYTLMRLIKVNIINTINTVRLAKENGAKKYFCVSTDKAANPVNMMGASKRIMEMFLMRESKDIDISMARFANVAFSDGSLLHGFGQRLSKQQPFSAPDDVKRYFITAQESGELCLMACLLGENRDIYYPKLSEKLHLITFSDIAKRYLKANGYDSHECSSEEEARKIVDEISKKNLWPCYFFKSDTTGEKDFEEFFTKDEILDNDKHNGVGIIKNDLQYNEQDLDDFLENINLISKNLSWSKNDILKLFFKILPDFEHKETGKYLDGRM